MTAYVIVQLVTSQDNATLLAQPDVCALLSAHDARVLPLPAAVRGGANHAPAPLTLVVPDMARAQHLAAALRAHAGVDVAYAKPAEAAP